MSTIAQPKPPVLSTIQKSMQQLEVLFDNIKEHTAIGDKRDRLDSIVNELFGCRLITKHVFDAETSRKSKTVKIGG